VRRSKEDTEQTRRDIVASAAKLFRGRGIDAVSVADVMGSLGLTVGGFYRHFDSKDALVAEAIDSASRATTEATGPGVRMVDDYLSRAHRDHPELGCPVAALCSEAVHQHGQSRRAFSRALQRLVERVGQVQHRRREQLQAAAAAVGALVLSRATDDPKLADELLEAVRDGLKQQLRATPRRRRPRKKSTGGSR